MTEQTEPEFNRADAAIQSIENDLLERDTFAIDIANSIRNWSSSESLVIGISGRWGEGKTSVLNMIKEALKEDVESLDDLTDPEESPTLDTQGDQAEGIQILEFQPWQFTGLEVIARSFFQDLGQKIGEADESDETKELGIKVQQLGNLLNRVGGVRPDGTLSWRAKVALTILGALLLSTNGLPEILSSVLGSETVSIPFWLSILIRGVIGLISFTAVLAPWVNYTADFLTVQSQIEEKTTSELRADIVDDLRERDHPLVVLIDDVDRLTIEEVKLLFQLVRSSASFPNVVYVMGLDVKRIRDELEEEERDDGYLDKIVQEIYDLPEIPEGRIEEYAKERILSDELLGKDSVRHFSASTNQRWNAVFTAATDAYFDTLRDVNRFLSSLHLQIGRFTRKDRFEANAVDLFAIHVLRVFELPVLQSLVENKEQLFPAPGPIADIDEIIDHYEEQEGQESAPREREKHLNELVDQAKDKWAVRSILASLFPYTAQYLLENGRTQKPDHANLLLDRRIAHPFYFRSYFQQRPAKRALSRAEEEHLRDLLRDPKDFRNQIKDWARNDRLIEGLHFVRSYVYEGVLKRYEHKTVAQAYHFEEWLVNQEQGSEKNAELRLLGEPDVPYEIARDTIIEIVRQEESESKMRALIESLLDPPPALRFARSVLRFVQKKRLLSNRALELLREKYAREVQEMAEIAKPEVRGTIYDRDDFAKIIVCWFEWGDAEEATDWLEKHIEEGELRLIALHFRTKENESEPNNGEIRFKPEFIKLLDGTRSTRDLRETALQSITATLSNENHHTRSDRSKLLKALKKYLKDSLNRLSN